MIEFTCNKLVVSWIRFNEWKWVYYCLSSDSLTLQEDMHLSQELNEYTYKMIYNQLDVLRNELRKVCSC